MHRTEVFAAEHQVMVEEPSTVTVLCIKNRRDLVHPQLDVAVRESALGFVSRCLIVVDAILRDMEQQQACQRRIFPIGVSFAW